MNHCVIAIKQKDSEELKSIVCYYQNKDAMLNALADKFQSHQDVANLIALGDLQNLNSKGAVAFHRDCGYAWNMTVPVAHTSTEKLVQFSRAISATHLLMFEGKYWDFLNLSDSDALIAA